MCLQVTLHDLEWSERLVVSKLCNCIYLTFVEIIHKVINNTAFRTDPVFITPILLRKTLHKHVASYCVSKFQPICVSTHSTLVQRVY